MAIRTSIAGLLVVAFALSGRADTQLHPRPRYLLRPGDTLQLQYRLTPEFNQTVVVQPDGYVTLKGVGSVFVQGQTVPELTETLKAAYAKILHDPVITVAPRDLEKPYFLPIISAPAN